MELEVREVEVRSDSDIRYGCEHQLVHTEDDRWNPRAADRGELENAFEAKVFCEVVRNSMEKDCNMLRTSRTEITNEGVRVFAECQGETPEKPLRRVTPSVQRPFKE